MRRRLSDPVVVSLVTATLVYAAFLLWPGSAWYLRIGGAVDWVGGALVIVGPLAAGATTWLTQVVLRHQHESGVAQAPWQRVQGACLWRPHLAHAALHVVVLAVAVGVAVLGGARGETLAGLAVRQLVALGFYVAIGHVVGIYVRGILAAPVTVIATFLLPWAAAALGSDMLDQTGGLSDVGSWAAIRWSAVVGQLMFWGGFCLMVVGIDPLTRRVRGGLRTAVAVLGAVALVLAAPALTDSAFASVGEAAHRAVVCDEPDAAGVTVCLTRESGFWRAQVHEQADAVVRAAAAVGAARPFDRVVEYGTWGGVPVASAGADLTGGDARWVSLSYETSATSMLVDELLRDGRCPESAAGVPFAAEAWFLAQAGEPAPDDVTKALDATPDHAAAWLRAVVDGLDACAASLPDSPVG